MKLAKNTKVTFAELPGTDIHKYYLTKRKGSAPVELIGATTLMKRMGVGSDYGNVKPDVLARAAARGTAIHEMFQGYEMGQDTNSTITFSWVCEDGGRENDSEDCSVMFRRYRNLSAENFKPVEVEYLVSDNECVASMIDFVSEVDAHTVDLIDYKSSSALDKKALAWQLSIYKVLFERQNPKIQVRTLVGVHCHDAKGLKLVTVPFVGYDAVGDLINRYKKTGEMDADSSLVPATLTMQEFLPDYPKLAYMLEMKRKMQDAIKEIDTKTAEALDALKQKLDSEHVSEVLVPGGKYIYVAEHTQKKFDSKRFQADHPEEYDKYVTTSMVASSIKFVQAK